MSTMAEEGKEMLQRRCSEQLSSIPKNPSAPSSIGSEGFMTPPRQEAWKKVESIEECGRERLERHRDEMAGRVCIPETWGQESLLKDWVDLCAFDTFIPEGFTSARNSLVDDCRQQATTSCSLEIKNRR